MVFIELNFSWNISWKLLGFLCQHLKVCSWMVVLFPFFRILMHYTIYLSLCAQSLIRTLFEGLPLFHQCKLKKNLNLMRNIFQCVLILFCAGGQMGHSSTWCFNPTTRPCLHYTVLSLVQSIKYFYVPSSGSRLFKYSTL